MMPLPVWLVVGPLLLAVPLHLFARRRPTVMGVIGAIGGLLLRRALINAAFSMDPVAARIEWEVMGRALILTEGLRQALLFIYAAAAVLFLLSALWPQGDDFVPGGLAVLALAGAALMIQPYIFGIALLVIVAAVMAVVLQSGRGGSTQAAMRYLLMSAIAIPLLLLAGWVLDTGSPAFVGLGWRLLLFGLLILLAGFPFFIWVRPIVSEAASLSVVFPLGIGQLVLLLLVGGVLSAFPAIGRELQFLALLRLSGGITVAVAAGLAFSSRDWGRLIGYLLLADMGAVILALSLGSQGWPVAVSLIVMRIAGLILVGVGLTVLRKNTDTPRGGQHSDLIAGMRGTAWRQPLAVGLLVLGIFSLAGFPLTPGFVARWPAVSLVATTSHLYATLLVLATLSGVIGAMRVVLVLGRPPADFQHPIRERIKNATRRELIGHLVLALLLLVGLLLALFPQFLSALASRFAAPLY